MRAKPTSIFGVDFRSRLEACWAMFFQCAGIPWLYEPQTFIFSRRAYIPDFCISPTKRLNAIYWIEVKPSDYGPIREKKHHEFHKLLLDRLNQNFCLMSGGPWDYQCWGVDPIASLSESVILRGLKGSYYPDIERYVETVAKAKRFLKQDGLLKYKYTLTVLKDYLEAMPECTELQNLNARCEKHLCRLTNSSPSTLKRNSTRPNTVTLPSCRL